MSVSTLPDDLVSLVHHVELSQAGWRDRAQELTALAALAELGGTAGKDQLLKTINMKLAAPLGRAQLEGIVNRLTGPEPAEFAVLSSCMV